MRVAPSLVLPLAFVAGFAGCRAKEETPDSPRLLSDMRNPDQQVAGQARLKLLQLGEPAVPALSEMLRSGAMPDRIAAANTLWAMGARARAAVPDADHPPRLRRGVERDRQVEGREALGASGAS